VEALESSIALAKPGVEAKLLFENCEKVLGRKMMHALGHGIGLIVHDFPQRISATAEWKLSEGMCLAVEPVIYEKNFGGIRTEDNILITKSGFKRLTKNPEELIEL
jgi:Xaa-Pro aminopeptidase